MSEVTLKPKATRQAFGEILAELGDKFQEIVVLDADLAKSTKSEIFAKKYPDRFFEMGIAEANMIGTGSGLALSGQTVFICSFGCFVTGRYDQIRMSVAYADANVRIIGTHAGVGIGDDGHSQMGLEDLSLMRGLPGMMVLQPCDETETRQMIQYLCENKGPAYVRLTRQNLASVHDANYKFKLGRFDFIMDAPNGDREKSIALLATGATVQEALGAAKILKDKGRSASVVNVHTIKPFDLDGIKRVHNENALIVSVEDHYTTGGLGSAAAEALSELDSKYRSRLVRLGIQDQFGESGEGFELYEKFGISSSKIAGQVLELAR